MLHWFVWSWFICWDSCNCCSLLQVELAIHIAVSLLWRGVGYLHSNCCSFPTSASPDFCTHKGHLHLVQTWYKMKPTGQHFANKPHPDPDEGRSLTSQQRHGLLWVWVGVPRRYSILPPSLYVGLDLYSWDEVELILLRWSWTYALRQKLDLNSWDGSRD